MDDAELVGRLALALVAPLGSEHHDRGHLAPPSPTGGSVRTRTGASGLPTARVRNSTGALAAKASRAPAGDARTIRPRRAAGAPPRYSLASWSLCF